MAVIIYRVSGGVSMHVFDEVRVVMSVSTSIFYMVEAFRNSCLNLFRKYDHVDRDMLSFHPMSDSQLSFLFLLFVVSWYMSLPSRHHCTPDFLITVV